MEQSFAVDVRWLPVADKDGTQYQYPALTSSHVKSLFSKPVVYRWRVVPAEPDGKETVYIGEAEDLCQRIQRVRTPGKAPKGGETNKRLKALFDEQLAKGKNVVLEIADFEPFVFNGARFSPDELHNEYKRTAVENLLLAAAQAAGNNVLNKYVDLVEKKLGKALPKLTSDQRRKLFEMVRELDRKKGHAAGTE